MQFLCQSVTVGVKKVCNKPVLITFLESGRRHFSEAVYSKGDLRSTASCETV